MYSKYIMAGLYNRMLYCSKGGYDEENIRGGRKTRSVGKRPLSEYNKFISKTMRQGYSMSQAANMWRNR
jgi:hypothetical protein